MADSDEHMWRLVGVVLGGDSGNEYECELCPATLVIPAGDTPPTTL